MPMSSEAMVGVAKLALIRRAINWLAVSLAIQAVVRLTMTMMAVARVGVARSGWLNQLLVSFAIMAG